MLTLAVVGAGLISSPAAAGVSFEVAAVREEAAFPGTREVTYRIGMLGAERDQTVRLELAPPRWSRSGTRSGAPAYPATMSLEGAGTFMPDAIAASPAAPRARGLALPCDEEVVPVGTRRGTVQLPAAARATLVTTWRLSRQAPFAFTDYRPRVTAVVAGVPYAIKLPRPRIVGPVGVPLRLLHVKRPARAWRTIRIRGRTDAALAGTAIIMRLVGPVSARRKPALVATRERFRTAGRARVDRLGRFEFRWRPTRRGHYGAYPLYLGKAGVILRDRGCPIRLVVR